MGIRLINLYGCPVYKHIGLIFFFYLITPAGGFAQIQKAFSPRFSDIIKGDFTMIANNVLSRTPTDAYNGENDNHSFFDNVFVDIDNDTSTFNSSNANFINPKPELACLTIKKAYLYWAAADKENDDGSDNQPDWNFNKVKIMLPGESNYSTLTADEILYRGRDTHFSNDPYVCFKDITELVTNLESPFGIYQVANVEAKTGFLFQHNSGNTGTSGGWQIVYVYESPELISKNVSIFDGYAHITRDFNNYDIDFSGFRTVPTGSVNVKTLIGSLEGDRSLIGDRFQIQNTEGNFIDVGTTLRDSFNFFNSKITLDNNNFTDRNPASLNTLGFDAAVFKLDNLNNSVIGNNQSSATIRLASNQETYSLFLIGLAIEVWVPSLYPITLNSDALDNTTNADNVVTFHINFSNTGNDSARNVVLYETLPENVTFDSANNLPNGVTYNYDATSRLLEFFVEDDYVKIGDPILNIPFNLKINNACYFLENTCNLSFNLLFTATYNGDENTNSFITFSSNTLNECQLGTPFLTNIRQPLANWETPVGSLDRTLSLNNPNDLTQAQSLVPSPDKCTFNLIKSSGTFVQNSDCDFEGTYTNTWHFTDTCGHTSEDFTQIITVPSNRVFDASNIKISKVVTPNQDQWNEFFTIDDIEGCGFVIDLKIFNRWGAIVYHSSNYQNNWNATSSSSAFGTAGKIPSGTYFYVIELVNSDLNPIISSFYVGTN